MAGQRWNGLDILRKKRCLQQQSSKQRFETKA
jgi:hypothetical protein